MRRAHGRSLRLVDERGYTQFPARGTITVLSLYLAILYDIQSNYTHSLPSLAQRTRGSVSSHSSLARGLITADKLPEMVGVLRTRSAAVAFAGASSPQALPLRFRFTFQFSSQRASLIRDAPSILFSFQQRHDPPRMPRCTRVAGPSTTRELCASQARFFFFLFPGCRGSCPPTATYICGRIGSR